MRPRQTRIHTRPPAALLTILLAGFGAAACGGNGGSARHTGSAADTRRAETRAAHVPPYARRDTDADDDGGRPSDDTSNNRVLRYGRAASSADRTAVTALVKRYYAAAAAGDGATACTMLYPTLAQAVPEDYGGRFGPSYLRGGRTCAAVMSRLFEHFHARLAAETPVLEVTAVRIKSDYGLALLSFGAMPDRQISVHRRRRTWRVVGLLDNSLP